MRLTIPQRILFESLVSQEELLKFSKQLIIIFEQFINTVHAELKKFFQSGLWKKIKAKFSGDDPREKLKTEIIDRIHEMRGLLEKVKLLESALEHKHGSKGFLQKAKERIVYFQEKLYSLKEEIIDLQTEISKSVKTWEGHAQKPDMEKIRRHKKQDERNWMLSKDRDEPNWRGDLNSESYLCLTSFERKLINETQKLTLSEAAGQAAEAAAAALAGLAYGVGGVAHGIGDVGIGAGNVARGVGDLAQGVGTGGGDLVRGVGELGLGVGGGGGEAAQGLGSAIGNLGKGIASILIALGKRLGVVFYNDTVEKVKDALKAANEQAKAKRLNEKQQQQHAFEMAKNAIEHELKLEIIRKNTEKKKAKL